MKKLFFSGNIPKPFLAKCQKPPMQCSDQKSDMNFILSEIYCMIFMNKIAFEVFFDIFKPYLIKQNFKQPCVQNFFKY